MHTLRFEPAAEILDRINIICGAWGGPLKNDFWQISSPCTLAVVRTSMKTPKVDHSTTGSIKSIPLPLYPCATVSIPPRSLIVWISPRAAWQISWLRRPNFTFEKGEREYQVSCGRLRDHFATTASDVSDLVEVVGSSTLLSPLLRLGYRFASSLTQDLL